jgi:phage FluMu protein Com
MAMLKTVKCRKANDLIAEAASELHVIDQKYAL